MNELVTAVRRSSSVVTALRAAAALRSAASSGGVSVGELTALLAGDAFSRAAALHALGRSPDPVSSGLLADALCGDRWSAEHASWALGDQSPVRRAAPALAQSVQKGGFAGFLAELTLEAWAASDAGLVTDALTAVAPDGPSGRAGALAAALLAPAARPVAPGGGGQVVAQLHLHAPLEGDLRSVGSGASGGLTTLAVNLAVELADRPEVDRVLTISQPSQPTVMADDAFAERAVIRPIRLGRGTWAAGPDAWPLRLELEAALTEALTRDGHLDVIHLRMADVATLAGWRVARRLGIAVVFTLAADPHAVLAARQRAGELDRRMFAAADLAEHLWFRTRLVEDLAADADHLVVFPRAKVSQEIGALTGVDLNSGRRPWSVVPEGVSVRAITGAAQQLGAVADGAPVPAVLADLARALDGLPPERRRLPLLVSVGRLHPVKGMDRFVSAWANCPQLKDKFNAVIIGGSLSAPDADEAAVLAALGQHRSPDSGVILLGNRPHSDALLILRAAADGVTGLIPGSGLYVCASAKEEFGLAVLEAIASGLRVVAPAQGGPATYIAGGATGFVCDTTSVEDLTKAIASAADLPLDTDAVRRARDQIAGDLTLERTAADLTAVYQATVTKRAA